jgi:hypothetical protein
MDKLEFGDFYKFIVSLGVVAIGLAILVFWYFLKVPTDTLIGNYSAVSPAAQQFIGEQQTALFFWVVT